MPFYCLRAVLLPLTLVALSFSVFGEPIPPQLDALYRQAVTADTVPGISVAVADANGVQWAQGYGFADVENRLPMRVEDKLRIGSVAKVMTAAGLMRLYQARKINLDKPVTDYVTAWPNDKPVITLRQLASHTAGVRHYKEGANEFLLNEHFPSVSASLALFKDDPLLFVPGTAFSYSTLGWTLISAAMEGADGKRNFQQIMQDEVFTPLRLNDTAFDEQSQIIPNRVRPYSVRDGKLINSPQTDHSYKWAAGGIIASAADVARFAVAQIDGHYLKPKVSKLMLTKAHLNDGKPVNVGIGWFIGFDDYRQRKQYKNDTQALALMDAMPHAVMHSGGSMGGITMTILCTEHHRAVTVVKNVDGDNSADVFLLALQTLSYYHQREHMATRRPM
ncbi:beta-lactamase family protein [Shewanella yunxiaonensis]|uniref:Beta-lactamase family protein n=1 Tax=Shewanella yunxiaonensis TaxID=2829809 RepID=A0ABX7YSE5_9GAMM|nr:serine hydrolase domain-containing protein [Shewanella yunxiaonensis]QUN05221.1 beta-lactamase family protein [Shewanella yunxiaonensis]